MNTKPSLQKGPGKIAVRVREGNVIKILAVEPKTYEYLTSNESENKDVTAKCKFYSFIVFLGFNYLILIWIA